MVSARNRDVSIRKALRKRRIAREIYHTWNEDDWQYYDNLHQYSKNKIHCSCPYCNTKTRNKGAKRNQSGNYQRAVHYSAADLRKMVAMDEDMREEGYYSPKHKRNRYS